jgi:hypothetical protein
LLPPPAEPPASLAGAPVAHPFLSDAAGGFSRVVFESSDAPDFKVTIREFSFPPSQPIQTLRLSVGGIVHVLSGEGAVLVGNVRLAVNAAARAVITSGTTLSVANTGQQPLTFRVLSVDPK